MTEEDRIKVYEDLFNWARSSKEQAKYLEERMYAVRVDIGMVVLVEAKSYDEALRRVCRIGITEINNTKTI